MAFSMLPAMCAGSLDQGLWVRRSWQEKQGWQIEEEVLHMSFHTGFEGNFSSFG